MSAPIDFTESAARKVYELISEEGDPNLFLRIYVTGGGCSGLQYGFTLDDVTRANDKVVEKTMSADENQSVIRVAVDAVSLQYLAGSRVDYKEDVSGAQFIIHNPHAKTRCGCGSSFAVDDGE